MTFCETQFNGDSKDDVTETKIINYCCSRPSIRVPRIGHVHSAPDFRTKGRLFEASSSWCSETDDLYRYQERNDKHLLFPPHTHKHTKTHLDIHYFTLCEVRVKV